ncbi:ABC transporter family substrate-binding protein [Nonomuraea sp. NPDC059194]|uniref:ABC transporter family substrate-binding protein n=1 Tax=Nonomuraea sp. NPDC059194 TaxID=3346764 RepID=UPI00368D999B
MRTSRLVAVMAVAGALALTGCGNGDGDTALSGPQPQGAEVKAFDVNLAARGQVKDGGTLRWGINQYPAQWNLNHVDGNLAHVKVVVDALLPSPFRSDQKAVISPNPDYLVGAKVTANDPKQAVTLTLNPKAKWSDGKAVTWRDYEAQWKAMNGGNTGYRVASTTGYQDIQSVARGRDDYEVVITFKNDFGDWQSLFAPLYPKSTNDSAQAFNAAWLNKVPISAGPFKFQAFDQTAKTITLVRDPAWWGEPAKLDQIIFRAMESDSLVGAFTNGEIDTFDIGPSAPDYARSKATQGAVVRQAAGPDFRHITMNGESAILSDVNVRRALTMAINRQAIAQSDLQGLDWPITLLDNHFFMNTQEGYQNNAGALGTYDVERAKAALDAAGWKLKGQTRAKNGKEMNLRFVMPSGLQLTKSEGELVQNMLIQLGVKVTLQAVPADDFFTKYIIPGNYDLTAFSYVGTPYPVSSGYGIYANATTDAKGVRQWNANLGRIGSPDIDMAMQRATAELDVAKARQLTNLADRLIWDAVNVVPLYQRPQNVAAKATLANLGARGFYDLRYQDIGFTG